MLLRGFNHTKSLSTTTALGTERQRPFPKRRLLGGILFLLGSLLVFSQPSEVLSLLTSWVGPRGDRVPPFVEELRRLSGAPSNFWQSADLAMAIAERMETIHLTGERLLENDILEALARADWYFFSGEDIDNLYQGRRLEISEGRMLSATRRFLQQRGSRLPVTIWNARRPDGSVMTGRIPPPAWAHNPPSDLTLHGYISLIRGRIVEQVPGLTNLGPILRLMEAALVAYVLMTADNGWIHPGRARIGGNCSKSSLTWAGSSVGQHQGIQRGDLV